MLVSCPQCKAKYQLATTINNAILVCHRCGTEFHTEQAERKSNYVDHEASLFEYSKDLDAYKTSQPAIPSSNNQSASAPEDAPLQQPQTTATIELPLEHPLPKRNRTHIWHWFILVLMCFSMLGIWYHQTQWLEQPWMRSLMMNMKFSITPKPADWAIAKDRLHSQWIDRQDHSRVLFIDGYIQNRLLSKQMPPAIHIRFFDMPNSRAIQTRTIAITEPPSLPTIRHAPYIAPAIDQIPIHAGGQRAFALILENIPKQARAFSIVVAVP